MESYDVLVVGAGPAGLAAAKRLAENSVDVICLDKKQEIGAPKRCAEGLGSAWFERVGIKPHPEWAVWEINGATFYSPKGKKLEVRLDSVSGYVLERKMFEKHLARDAAKAGAKIFAKHMVQDVKRVSGKVVAKVSSFGDEKEIAANLVIACDGVESKIARQLGMNTTNKLIDIDAGFQYEMANIDFEGTDLINLFFGTEVARRGYVWIFPKGKHEANVGVGIAGDSPKTAKYYLDKFVQNHSGLKNGSIIEVNCGCVPVGGFLDSLVANNLLVAGDAAHQVNPAHGGGIGIAMEGGQLAADTALEALKRKDFSAEFLAAYTEKWYAVRGDRLKRVLKARHMLEAMNDDDFEVLAESLTSEDILKIAGGDLIESAKTVTKKLIKNPKLAGLMLKYLK